MRNPQINDNFEFCFISYSTCTQHGIGHFPVVRLVPGRMELDRLGYPWGIQITEPFKTDEEAVKYAEGIEIFMKEFVKAYTNELE